jgi:NitT/TauT family transport system substrate-binding protein
MNISKFVARRSHGISGPAGLKGKTIGVTIGTDTHFLIEAILARHGMVAGDVIIKNFRPDEMMAELSAQTVDAVATWDPWLSRASQEAGDDGRAMYPEKGFSFGFHLVGGQAYVREHPATTQKPLRALRRAERYLDDEPQAARAVILAGMKSDPPSFDVVWSNFNLSPRLAGEP